MTRFPTTPFKKSVGDPDTDGGGGGVEPWSGGGGVCSSMSSDSFPKPSAATIVSFGRVYTDFLIR